MEALETQIKVLDATMTIPLPEEMLKTLGLHEGSRVAIFLKEGEIIVRPMKGSLHDQLERWRDVVSASGIDLSQTLAQQRREERKQEDRLQ